MVANRRRPGPLAVSLHLIIPGRHDEPIEHLADNFPVHQIPGVQYLNADKMEIGGDEIKIVAVAENVGIRIIGFKNGFLYVPSPWSPQVRDFELRPATIPAGINTIRSSIAVDLIFMGKNDIIPAGGQAT